MTRRARLYSALLLLACSSGPTVTVSDATEIGTLRPSPRIVGRDGAYSARVWGNEVWTFGDTFLSVVNVDGDRFVSNTFSLSQGALVDGGFDLSDRLDDAGAPDLLLRPTVDEATYDTAHRSGDDGGCSEQPCGGRWATWPGPTLFDEDAGVALTFYGLVSAAPGDFNFYGVGQSLARWSDFDALPERPAPGLCADSPTLLFCRDEPGFGTAAALSDGDVYAFGCVQSGAAFPCQLGRVPFAGALDRTRWEFWSGSAWSSDLAAATPLFDGSSIMGLSFNAYLNQWLLVYARPLDNQVVFRTAAQVTGPWSAEAQLFIPDRKGQGGNTYDALPHPELAEEGGRVQLVTFSRSDGTTFGSEFAVVRVRF